jgi:hypothetical protein
MNRRTITQEQFWKECEARFGMNVRDWQFVCPMCGTKQSVASLLAAGVPLDKVEGVIAYSCIGRFTGQGDDGIAAKAEGKPWDKGCNWTLGGLLQMHELEVLHPDGTKRFCFEIAQ